MQDEISASQPKKSRYFRAAFSDIRPGLNPVFHHSGDIVPWVLKNRRFPQGLKMDN
jgi:hypothetical protein